jgi:colanic acid biosynthesis glycosyl transferase WcaI
LLRLLIVVQNYPPERGPVRYTCNVAMAMASYGHEVTVVTGIPHYPGGKTYSGFQFIKPTINVENGVKVIRTPLVMGSNRQLFRRMLGFITFFFSSLPWLLFSAKPDLIIASVPPLTDSLAGWVAARFRRKSLIVILRDIEPLDSLKARGFENSAFGRCLSAIFINLYKSASKIVVIHPEQLDTLSEYNILSPKAICIPHSIDVVSFLEKSKFTAPLIIPRKQGRKIALYIGSLGICQDIQTLIKVASDPRIGELPIDFAIVGDGESKLKCQNILSQLKPVNVSMFPTVSLESVPGVIMQADILVLSFKNDINAAISSKFYEYCASGKPIIVFGDNIAADLIESIGNGWACRARDADSLSEIIEGYFSSKTAFQRDGFLGRYYIEKYFSIEDIKSRWHSLINSIAER